MSAVSPVANKLTHPWMRLLLWVAAALVFIAGVQLFVLSEQTERFFAWTIKNPLTAAFLGAAYWTSCVLEGMAARERLWARARIAVPAVLLFTALTLTASLLHLDQFHLGSGFAPETTLLTWTWLAIYALVPPALLALLLFQAQLPGGDPPVATRIPTTVRVVISAQAAVLVSIGAMLFALPQATLAVWPWPLTPLAARAVGAWLLGLGIAAAQVMLENEWARARPVAASCVAFSLLQALALARYPQTVHWASGSAWFYLAFLASLLILGVAGWLAGRRPGAAA